MVASGDVEIPQCLFEYNVNADDLLSSVTLRRRLPYGIYITGFIPTTTCRCLQLVETVDVYSAIYTPGNGLLQGIHY